MPIAHTGILVPDLEKAKAFYTIALAPLNYSVAMEFPGVVGFGTPNSSIDFWLKGTDGAKVPNVHLAFAGDSEEMVKEFHAAAL